MKKLPAKETDQSQPTLIKDCKGRLEFSNLPDANVETLAHNWQR
jgi:hypothetical protein